MDDFFIKEFYEEIAKVDFAVYGIIDKADKIHTLGTDSKIIGRIFEMCTQPILERIAQRHGLILKTPESQTVYPDFIMMENEKSKTKIAIDVKSTYVESDDSPIKFTLGSYGSYMRNNTKNIEYKYTDYAKHYVIGFVYKRNGFAQESQIFDYEERTKIPSPFTDVRYFVQEKYKIAGDKPGSGNTENIGSISSSTFDDFVSGNGPFASLGIDIYDLYWKYYPKYRVSDPDYHTLEEFLKWLPDHKDEVELLHDFDLNEFLERLEETKKINA